MLMIAHCTYTVFFKHQSGASRSLKTEPRSLMEVQH